MSNSEEAYRAGQRGENWQEVKSRLGEDYATKRAYEDGSSRRVYGGNQGGSEAFGAGMGAIGILIAGFWLLTVIYSPLISIAFILLYPIWPSHSTDYFGTEYITYAVIFVALLYLLSCGFEYLRAKMLVAREKNQAWMLRFLLLFYLRIIFPGMAICIAVYLNKESELGIGLTIGLLAIGLLLWKVKLLNEENRFFFTGWAFNRGVHSLRSLPWRELKPVSMAVKHQVLLYYILWLIITTFLGATVSMILSSFISGGSFSRYIIFNLIGYSLGCWLAFLFLERASSLFLKYSFATSRQIKIVVLLRMALIAALCLGLVRNLHFNYLISFCLYFLVLIIQIMRHIKVRPYEE